MAKVFRNWEGSRSIRPKKVFAPKDTEEVARFVKEAYERGEKVKALGSILSWSDIHDAPDNALVMTNMARVLHVASDALRVKIQAGIRLNALNKMLAEKNLALNNFGSITTQTVAGYVGTGSHGTCSPILASLVTEMTLVDGTGRVLEISAQSEPTIFRFARVHLGCLGVVTEVTLTCQESFWLEERLELVEFDVVLADIRKYVRSNDYVKFWWLPYQRDVQVYRYNRVAAGRPSMGFSGLLDKTGISGAAFSTLIGISNLLPQVIPPLLGTVQAVHFRPRVRINRSDLIIPYAGSIPRHQETEYAVACEDAPKVIEEIRRLVMRPHVPYRVNFPLEVRFVPADEIPMSPAYKRDSCFIGPYIASRRWAGHYFRECEEVFRQYQGRPHWGKHFSLTSKDLATLYPEWSGFMQMKEALDPANVFANAFTERCFGQA